MRMALLLALVLATTFTRGNTMLEAAPWGDQKVQAVVVGGPNHPVLTVQLPGLWKNLSGGFENGAVVKVDGTYHMFTTAWASGVYSHDIVAHFSSPDRYNWTFLEQVAGCHWQNSSDSADGTGVPLWYDPVAPMPYFNSEENRWEMFHIWCIAQRVTWSPNCTCVRRVSKVLGNAGIYGPWVEVDAVLSPEPGSQPWEGATLDSISNPFKVNDTWLVFIGGSCCAHEWLVGLASSPNITGPFTRLPTGNPVPLINPPTFNENPLVYQLPSGVYVSVFDFLEPEVTSGKSNVFGFSYSNDGVNWPASNGAAVSLAPSNGTTPWFSVVRTPLGLIDEGNGTYTMFYTAWHQPPGQPRTEAVGFAILELKSSPAPPPSPPPPPPPFVPWVEVHGKSAVYGVPITGQPNAPLLGSNVKTDEECRALCEARSDCTMYVGSYDGVGGGCTGEWCWLCFGRTDTVWDLVEVEGFVSARRIPVPPTETEV